MSGLGAASADAVYGSVVAFGVTALSSLLLDHRVGIRVVGGVVLCYLGVQAFRAEPADVAALPSDATSLARDFGSTFLLTVTNPVTILAFLGIFAGLGVGVSGDYRDAVALVGGVFAGSALWWFVLSAVVSLLRTRVTRSVLGRVNRLAGTVVVGFGLLALWSGL